MERQYEGLIQALGGIVWEADPQTFQFTFVSQFAEHLLGYPLSQWLHDPTFWQDHLHPEDRSAALSYCLERSKGNDPYDFEYRMLAADGRVVWIRDLVTFLLEPDGRKLLCGFMLDITAQKQAADSFRKTQAQLMELVQERERLNHDLHDNIVQSLFAIGMHLDAVVSSDGVSPGVRDELKIVIASLNHVLRDVRRYAYGHDAQDDSTSPLADRLTRLAARINAANRMRVHFTADPTADGRLTEEQAEHLLAIAGEAMSNALRHSKGETVHIRLRLADDRVILEVADDGIGFRRSGSDPSRHGLGHMESRAAAIGATFEITSVPLRGTRVVVSLPLHQD